MAFKTVSVSEFIGLSVGCSVQQRNKMTQMHRLFFYGLHLTLHIRRILVLHTMSQKKVGSRVF